MNKPINAGFFARYANGVWQVCQANSLRLMFGRKDIVILATHRTQVAAEADVNARYEYALCQAKASFL